MTVGLLDFFILEASECVERIDFLLARTGPATPDLDAFARNARELRGAATMARQSSISEIATVLERIVRGVKDGSLTWSEALRAHVIAAVDDLKSLIHGVRSWGPGEQDRADARLRELNALAPAFRRRSSLTPITASGNARFLADETASVAAGLQRFADSPNQLSLLSETLARVRALRGVAALSDLPPLAEVIAAVDDAGKPIELGTGVAGDAQRQLFRSAAAVLREGSDAVHNGGRPSVDTPAVQAFTAAAATFIEGTMDADFVVPVSSLFPDGTNLGAVHASPNPPSTPTERFRLEVVSHAEHLRRLVSDARRAVDPPSRQRIGHELRNAVRALWRAAESFGEGAVARTLFTLIEGAATLDERTLASIDEAASILTASGSAAIANRFATLETPAREPTPVATQRVAAVLPTTPVTPARPATPAAPIAVAAPVPPMTPPAASTPETSLAPVTLTPPVPMSRVATPAPPPAARQSRAGTSGAALHDMLGAGLAGLSALDEQSMSEPVDVEDESAVPIGDLLYRGQAALRRAVALGDAFKRGVAQASPDALAELYDLLELATTE